MCGVARQMSPITKITVTDLDSGRLTLAAEGWDPPGCPQGSPYLIPDQPRDAGRARALKKVDQHPTGVESTEDSIYLGFS